VSIRFDLTPQLNIIQIQHLVLGAKMSASPSATYAAKLALYDEVLAAVPGVERKGDTVPYTSHNGHMFTYLSKAGVMAL
jgi:hypothetical protein